MTENELKRRFPNASPSFIKANLGDRGERVCAIKPKPDERLSLDGSGEREEACWHDASECFEIVFTVFARKPCDWDGYDIKALQDFCIKAGIIPDDGWKTLSGRVYSRKVATEAEEKTIIEITPIN